MRVSAEGKEPTMLVREEKSDLRIIRAPNSDQIAYLIRGLEGYGPLKLIDGAGGEAQRDLIPPAPAPGGEFGGGHGGEQLSQRFSARPAAHLAGGHHIEIR